MFYEIHALGCWVELWGRERSVCGGDKFCGDSFRSDKCCGLTLTVTKTSLSTPSSFQTQNRPATKEKIHYLSQIWDTHTKSQEILSEEGAMPIKRGIYSLLTSARNLNNSREILLFVGRILLRNVGCTLLPWKTEDITFNLCL